jgi:hypothetical protein
VTRALARLSGNGASCYNPILSGTASAEPRHANSRKHKETAMAERTRTRRNTLERRCLGKAYKRLFVGSTRSVFKMLEKIKKA